MTSLRRKIAIALLPAALTGGLLFGTPAPTQAAPVVETLNNGVFTCPRNDGVALFDARVNKTFFTWGGTNHDIYIKAFDHATNRWSAPVKVVTLNLTDDNAYHDYPVLTQLADGRLAIFRAQHNRSAWMYVAPTPRSISGTWSGRRISTDRNTYPEPVVVGNTVYLFYSQSTDLSYPMRTYRMIKSTNSGVTWSQPQTVIDSGRIADRFAEVYTFGVFQRANRIYLGWSMHGGPQGHNKQGKNIYTAYFDTRDSTMRTIGGSSLGTTINGNELGRVSAVTTNPNDIAADKWLPEENPITVELDNGTIVLGYGVATSRTRRIVLAVYNGRGWTSTTVDSTTSNFKDMVASGRSVEFVYATADNKRLISKRWTPGGGLTTAFNVAVPYANGSDEVFFADFVEYRSTISVIASTIHWETKTAVDDARWPLFAVRR